MKNKLLAALMCLSAAISSAQHQGPHIVFNNTEHDFGTIKEEGGKVKHRFEFSNNGAQPLIINRVQASCGCTTSEYTKQPVTTGQTGFIEVSFDPLHRPGTFSKTITVSSNSNQPTTLLTIKGTVTPKPRTLEDDYPQSIGSLRLQNNYISFMNITNGETPTSEMPVINTANEPITVTFEDKPQHLTLEVIPQTLKPQEKGVIKATLRAKDVNDLGLYVSRIPVLINGKKIDNNMLMITAHILEDFSKLTHKQLADAPKIKFEQTNYDFGTVKSGALVIYEYKFTNEGKEPLIIRKVKTGCGCTASDTPTEAIKAGQSSAIKISFNTRGRTGRQAQYIDVYCNDPKQSEIKLKIGGTLEKVE